MGSLPPCTLHSISPHVWWFTPDRPTDRPSLGAVVGARGTLLLDAGASPAHTRQFLHALNEHNLAPIRYAALTHWHWDHSFGASALDVPLIAHVDTARVLAVQAHYDFTREALDQRVRDGREIAFCRDMMLAEWGDALPSLDIIHPEATYNTGVTLDLGGVTCEIAHVGGDHAADSSVMFVPEDRVLFLGDSLYHDIYAPQNRYTTAKLFPLLDRVMAYDAEWFVQGHHDEVMTRAALAQWAGDLRTIGALVEQIGADREQIIAHLPPLADDENVEYVDLFLAGLG